MWRNVINSQTTMDWVSCLDKKLVKVIHIVSKKTSLRVRYGERESQAFPWNKYDLYTRVCSCVIEEKASILKITTDYDKHD